MACLPLLAMKRFGLIVALTVRIMMSGILGAQDRRPFVIQPYLSAGHASESRFWTGFTIGLVALDGAAKAADSFATRKNIDGGGVEYNPMARPFVHTTSVQVVATAALFGAEVATAYLLHRRRFDKLGRAVLLAGATMNGLGAGCSIQHRVAHW